MFSIGSVDLMQGSIPERRIVSDDKVNYAQNPTFAIS